MPPATLLAYGLALLAVLLIALFSYRALQERARTAAFPDRLIEIEHEGDLQGEWDIGRLGQLASNLIGNALQHGCGGKPIQVRLDGRQADSVQLTVENAGAIASDVLRHVFDPFRGGQRQPGRSDGLGLGLYIVQQIATAHGGRVDVLSPQAHRTRFQVSLPRHASDVVPMAGRASV